MIKPWTVWTMDDCVWCERVKTLLTNKGIPFMIHNPPLVELKVRMREIGVTTLPQVFDSGDVLIGGYNATEALLASSGNHYRNLFDKSSPDA